MPTIVIDGRTVVAREGAYVLEAARAAGVNIPTLCQHEAVEPSGACRLCMVDVTFPDWNGWYKIVAACLFPVAEGMIVVTDSERVVATRKVTLDLLLARCPNTPVVRKLAAEYGIAQTSYVKSPDPSDCILCGLCTRVCDKIGVSAIGSVGRGFGREISPPNNEPPKDCIGCLSCANICPTGYIKYQAGSGFRTIWGRTFKTVPCVECGRSTITEEQAAYYAGKNGVNGDAFKLCDECKRRKQVDLAKKLMGL